MALQQSKKLKVNGGTLAYSEAGEGKMPVIFIHGFPFNKTSWQPQFEAMSKHRRVIAFDQRGYGESERRAERMSIDLLATDLIQLMDALKIDRAIGCGLSMGGYVLMNAVSRFPERFAGIVLADTQCIADSDENRGNRMKSIEEISSKGMEPFTEKMLQKLFSPKSLQTKTELVEATRKMMLTASPEVVKDTLQALADRKETCNALKAVKNPALIICGKEDGITPRSQSELMNNALVNSVFHEIIDAGHLSNLEQPDEFNEQLRKFVKGIAG
jgi:3-oxoadipate enol-lactonase